MQTDCCTTHILAHPDQPQPAPTRATVGAMSDPNPFKTPEREAEFTRKLVLGLLSTLESKGLLSETELNSILRAARLAAYPVAPARPAGPAGPGTRWVKPGQTPTQMDRSTPIGIPDVRRNDQKDDGGDSLLIDMELD
ncbi:hypothetical protein [Deinococcus arenicola]|uniref:Nitrile hydratase subunit beta n=1 Tax=Deinococcus arenicola TaxID=2994950 RepID=A0ABU4DSZ8_9DEIO|nr:hypothetical protein [Deinococcus sp. ZS9-10]MDV6374809.1 hypothetical protein [Deinococcus sp. ZS9-10]